MVFPTIEDVEPGVLQEAMRLGLVPLIESDACGIDFSIDGSFSMNLKQQIIAGNDPSSYLGQDQELVNQLCEIIREQDQRLKKIKIMADEQLNKSIVRCEAILAKKI